jgi:beta-phosphoglucomutase-like phosphatase (HAD superfamily)
MRHSPQKGLSLDQGIKMAVVSSSQNYSAVLRAVGLADLFDIQVDGTLAAELQLG